MGKMKRPKVGIALSGGSARGLSYIGIIEVLEENGIPIDYIAGTSIGSLIGALYASGMPIREMKDFFSNLNWQSMADLDLPKSGLIKGERAERYISSMIGGKKFEDLNIPLSVIAADLNTGAEVVFDRGDVARAVRASISVPVIFSPVRMNGMNLVDGGIVNPCPVDIVKKMGADVVIAIDTRIAPNKVRFKESASQGDFWKDLEIIYFRKLGKLIERKYLFKMSRIMRKIASPLFRIVFQPHKVAKYLSGKEVPEIVKVVDTSNLIMTDKLMEEKLSKDYVDVIIKPELEMYYLEFNRMDYCVGKGREAAKKALPKLKKLLA